MDSSTSTQGIGGKTFGSIRCKQSVELPSKEQGIVFNAISELPQQYYFERIANCWSKKHSFRWKLLFVTVRCYCSLRLSINFYSFEHYNGRHR